MLFRCLDYWKEICERWPGVELVQVVIYLGDGPMTMVSRITNGENYYGFNIFSLKDVEADEFLDSDSAPEPILIGPVRKFGSARDHLRENAFV